MPLKLAFVLDPLDVLKAWKDSSVAMMRAAENQGHEVFAIDAATLGWRQPEADAAGGVFGEAVQLALRPDDHDWFRELGCEIRPLTDFGPAIMGKAPPFDFEYLTATWLLERAEADGVRVFNRPCALRDHSEKLATAEFDQFTPQTLVARDMASPRCIRPRTATPTSWPIGSSSGWATTASVTGSCIACSCAPTHR